ASRPLESIALAALGYRALSLSPAAIGPVKSTLLRLDVEAARAVLLPLLADTTGTVDVRGALRAFAEQSGLLL
ncbi:MAG: hypothetical protein B7Z45_01085, partial [Azorhizobium sp. 12-66-6]